MTASTEHPALDAALEAQRDGRWLEAEAYYREALASIAEPDAVLLSNFGQVLRRQGLQQEAMAVYAKATALADAPPAAWFNLGNAQLDQRRWQEAQASFEQALSGDPAMEPAALQLARCAVKLGQWPLARERFAAVLKGNPQNFSAWLEAGHVCRHHGTVAQALACYRHAAQVAPQRWLGHATLARALEDTGAWEEAAVHAFHALMAEDGAAGLLPLRMLGRARVERGDAARACEAFVHALQIAPQDHATMVDLADALMRLGEAEGAKRLFTQAGTSFDADVLTMLATVLFRYNFWEQAEEVLRALVVQSPEDWTAHFKLAKLLIESWRMEEGLERLAMAEQRSATPIEGALGLRAAAAAKVGDVDQGLALYRELGEREGPRSPTLSSAAMAALYSDRVSAMEASQLHRTLFAPLGEGARQSFGNDRSPTRRLRVGYVTADLHHQHPVNLFMQPVLARHDATAFEITVYFVGITFDEQSRLAKSRVARWRDVHSLDDRALARVIEEDQIDVLVDLIGHTSYNRRTLFAQRAAPVQATFLGYPGSTGLPNMDWIIADPEVAPEADTAIYSERVARLPHCVFCYAPEVDYPYPVYDETHAQRPLTFGSFNNISKLTPRTIALWAKVLAAVPKSRLMLKAPSFMDPGAMRRFAGLFGAAGVAEDRLIFSGPSSLQDMMAEYELVDIALDTLPYNGGTTTYQALWMGVPVVALRGEGFCQRMGHSILSAIGRPEWVAKDEANYVAIAKRLARDRSALLAAKRELRSRMQASPGLDVAAYTRDMERLFRDMWTDWCSRAD